MRKAGREERAGGWVEMMDEWLVLKIAYIRNIHMMGFARNLRHKVPYLFEVFSADGKRLV